MARKDKKEPQRREQNTRTADQSRQPDEARAEEADGYRRTRRGAQREAEKPAEKPLSKPQRQLGKYEAFVEAHWESWLRPVLLLALLGVGILGYKWDLIPEGMAGMLAAAGIVLAAIYSTAMPALELMREQVHRSLFWALVAAWAFSAGYPALRKAVPRPVLAEALLTEQSKSAKLSVAGKGGGTGPFDLTVGGRLDPGVQQAVATYEITVTAQGGVTETVEGEFEQSVHQTRVRRGTTHWTESHDQNMHRLSRKVAGSELTLQVDRVDELLKEGLHVYVHPQDIVLRLLMPRLGGVEVPVLGILVLLLMLLVEARVGDAKNKTHLTMAAAVTLIFSYRFSMKATSTRLVAPAVEALFMALVFGGIGGTLLGWTVRRWSGRSKLKPPKPERTEDEEND